MSDVAYLAQMRDRAQFLVHRETQGSGDTEKAMRRVARRLGVSYGFVWSLRHRPPKIVDKILRAYFCLEAAYEAERGRQQRKFDNEITRIDPPLGRASASVDGEEDGRPEVN